LIDPSVQSSPEPTSPTIIKESYPASIGDNKRIMGWKLRQPSKAKIPATVRLQNRYEAGCNNILNIFEKKTIKI